MTTKVTSFLHSGLRQIQALSFWRITILCFAINLGLGLMAVKLHLPLFLDSIGTILATSLAGKMPGLLSGIGFTLISTYWIRNSWLYSGTVVGIVFFTAITKRYGFLRKWGGTLACAPLLAILCAYLSAPITLFVLRGYNAAPDDLSRYFAVRININTFDSVVLAGLIVELFDKTLSSFAAFGILRLITATSSRQSRRGITPLGSSGSS